MGRLGTKNLLEDGLGPCAAWMEHVGCPTPWKEQMMQGEARGGSGSHWMERIQPQAVPAPA